MEYSFSSEIKPIVKLLDVKLNKSEINETEFKLFGYINSPKTIYQNLKKSLLGLMSKFSREVIEFYTKTYLMQEDQKELLKKVKLGK